MGFGVGNAKHSKFTFTPDFKYKTTNFPELPSNQSKLLVTLNINRGLRKPRLIIM